MLSADNEDLPSRVRALLGYDDVTTAPCGCKWPHAPSGRPTPGLGDTCPQHDSPRETDTYQRELEAFRNNGSGLKRSARLFTLYD